MQFLSATTDVLGIHYSVWLDTTKFQVVDGTTTTNPDPAYVRNYDWAPAPSNWLGGASAYQQMTETEVKLLAQADLDAINNAANPTPTPTPLSVNGSTF